MTKLSVKELAFTAMMTCCNSVSELTVGNFLHLINFSMKGSVLVGINLMIYTLLFSRIPRFGVVTLCGFGTALVNFMLTGGFKIFALYCIVLEALVVDIIFHFGGLKRNVIILAGAAAGVTSCLCSFFNGMVFMGASITNVMEKLAQAPWVAGHSVAFIIAFILLWRVVVGLVFGGLAYKVLEVVKPDNQIGKS
jgi:hypothetical protein